MFAQAWQNSPDPMINNH